MLDSHTVMWCHKLKYEQTVPKWVELHKVGADGVLDSGKSGQLNNSSCSSLLFQNPMYNTEKVDSETLYEMVCIFLDNWIRIDIIFS